MSRLKRVFKWIGIGLGLLVVIALVINAILVWRSGSQLRAEYAKIRAAGDPVFLSDLAEPPVPPEENAFTYVQQATDDLRPAQKELSEALDLRGFETGDLSADDLRRVETLLEAHAAVVPLLEKASQCPRYVLPVDYSLPSREFLEQSLSPIQDVRSAMRCLYIKAVWLQAKGDRESALETCLLMLRLARRVGQQPMLVGGLVAVACRGYPLRVAAQVLQTQSISTEMRQSLETELGSQDVFAACRWALKSDRAYSVTAYQDVVPLRKNWLTRAYWDRDELMSLQVVDRLTVATGQPWNRLQAIYQQVDADASRAPLARLAIPAWKAGQMAYYRTEAMIRCLRVLNALQQHATPGSDVVPSLSGLGLPPEATQDPFTGNPLTVKRLPKGWLIYSFGPDGDDDGGRLTDDGENDIGIGPPGTSEEQAGP
jgi:hypothetical protein